MTLYTIISLGLLLLMPAIARSQSVSERNGCIYFRARNGIEKQITDSHLDSQPNLSFDGRLIVFVRRTPGHAIATGLPAMEDENELWVAHVDNHERPKRVLVGRAGGFTIGPGLVLAGFGDPQFSPDGKRVYFTSDAWATAAAIQMLDLITGATKFLFPGLEVDVIRAGRYKGFLIGTKDPITEDRGRITVYWLLDPNGREIKRIGETDSDLDRFKRSEQIH